MKSLEQIKLNPRIEIIETGEDGGAAWVNFFGSRKMLVIFSWGEGWDHVSASYKNRCPTWEEMCKIKEMFWNDDVCVLQYHPPQKDYINCHPYCLHLWKQQNQEIVLPPKHLIA